MLEAALMFPDIVPTAEITPVIQGRCHLDPHFVTPAPHAPRPSTPRLRLPSSHHPAYRGAAMQLLGFYGDGIREGRRRQKFNQFVESESAKLMVLGLSLSGAPAAKGDYHTASEQRDGEARLGRRGQEKGMSLD
jgi:hypothetical protein